MKDNPYDSSSTIGQQPITRDHRVTTARPVGISILAALHFVGGIILFGGQFLLFANLQAMEDSLRSVGMPPALLIAGVMFLAVLATASGVGMWIGAKWGWWLGSFYYVYSIFRNGSALLTIVAMSDQFEGNSRGIEYYLIKHIGRIVVHALLFLYFFKGSVLGFFGMKDLNKATAIAIPVGICIAVMAATSAIGFVAN